jgi:nitric oxide reductase subunit C
MSMRLAKWIFWMGTLISAGLFLALTVDTHRQIDALTHADRLSEDVVAGKRVFQKYNCNDCHTILGFGGYYAPDLTRVYSRKGEGYIRAVVSHPDRVLEGSFRKMPDQNVTEAEIDKLLAFFEWVDRIENNDWPPQDSSRRRGTLRLAQTGTLSLGAAVFQANGCYGCHSLHGTGGSVGPALDSVGLRLDAHTLKRQITEPATLKTSSIMPAY